MQNLDMEIVKQKLQESDWSVLPDVDMTLVNKAEFAKYRENLRIILIQKLYNAVLPPEPTPIWSAPTEAVAIPSEPTV